MQFDEGIQMILTAGFELTSLAIPTACATCHERQPVRNPRSSQLAANQPRFAVWLPDCLSTPPAPFEIVQVRSKL
jgi:hypothetical protein